MLLQGGRGEDASAFDKDEVALEGSDDFALRAAQAQEPHPHRLQLRGAVLKIGDVGLELVELQGSVGLRRDIESVGPTRNPAFEW